MNSGTIVFRWAWAALEGGWWVLSHFAWQTLVDIALMTWIVYHVYIRFRGTRAMRILAGIVLLRLAYMVAQGAGLFLTSWVLGGVWAAALILVIVVFQGEIRQMLERVNLRLPLATLLRRAAQIRLPEEGLVTVAETAFRLATKRWGALLVFERQDFLEPLLRSPGALIDARVHPELLETIFSPQNPLHDGAVYLRGGRAYRAACVLPVSAKPELASFYGTRHRAALGISEQSDALAVVVSEQRGTVSVVEHGTLTAVETPTDLLAWLTHRLQTPGVEPKLHWSRMAWMTHHWRPKLAALAAVSLLWFLLVGQQNAEVGLSLPVVYLNLPEGLTIEGTQVHEVQARVLGSKVMLKFLDPSRLQVAINLEEARAGSHRHTISASDMNLPLGLQLAGVTPSRIELAIGTKPAQSKA